MLTQADLVNIDCGKGAERAGAGDEVRTLADRAAQAAKEARAMVGEAEQALAAGGLRARETGERLQALGALVGRAGVEMGEVAARVDAQDAAAFVQALRGYLECPAMLFVH